MASFSVQILVKNYDAVATKGEAEAYWAIFPKTKSESEIIAMATAA